MRKIFAILLFSTGQLFAQSLPFTPFQGYGSKATGGTHVVHVKNLKATGKGSLTEALSSSGNHVIFDVAGAINGSFNVPANTTIDGFSAPPPGITLTGGGSSSCLLVHSSNVIIQGLRLRDCNDKDIETFGASGPIHDIVIDHVEMLGSGDEDLATTNVHDYTLSWSIIGNNTNSGCQLIAFGSFNISDHHNLFYGCNGNDSRVPLIGAGYGCCSTGPIRDFGIVADVQYNVSSKFLYGITAADDGITRNYGNIANNYLDGQDGDHARNSLDVMGNEHTSYYLEGNASVMNPAGPPSSYYVSSAHSPFCVINSNRLDCTRITVWAPGAICGSSRLAPNSCQPSVKYAVPAVLGPAACDSAGRIREWNDVIDKAGVVFKFADDTKTAAIRRGITRPTAEVLNLPWNTIARPCAIGDSSLRSKSPTK